MKILFDSDRLPGAGLTKNSKELRFANLENRISEIDEKFALILARNSNALVCSSDLSEEFSTDKAEFVGDESLESVDETSTAVGELDDGAAKRGIENSAKNTATNPKTRAGRLDELERKLVEVSEKFDKLTASVKVESIETENGGEVESKGKGEGLFFGKENNESGIGSEDLLPDAVDQDVVLAEESEGQVLTQETKQDVSEKKAKEKPVKKARNRAEEHAAACVFAGKASNYLLMVASVLALVFTLFIGVSIVDSGAIRNVEPEIFCYFSEHSFVDYFAAFKSVDYAALVVADGFYPTETLVSAYEILYVTRAVIVSFTVVAVIVSLIFAIKNFVLFLHKKESKPTGALAAVLLYLCGSAMLFAVECGKISLAYVDGKKSLGEFSYTLRLNDITCIGIVIVACLLVLGLIGLSIAKQINSVDTEKPAAVKRFPVGEEKNSLKTKRLCTFLIVAVSLLSVLSASFAGYHPFGVVSERETTIYGVEFESGLSEGVDVTEKSLFSMPIVALVQKYSLSEESVLSKMETYDYLLKYEPDNLDYVIGLEDCELELENVRVLAENALNVGVTSLIAAVVTIFLCGLLAFVTLGKFCSADVYVSISILPATAATFNALVAVFTSTSFGKYGVTVSSVLPFLAFVCAVGATVCAFLLRPYILKSTGKEKSK